MKVGVFKPEIEEEEEKREGPTFELWEFEVTPRQHEILSVKMLRLVKKRIERVSQKYGWTTSEFVRFVLCSVLYDLGELNEKELGMCLRKPKLHAGRYLEEDPELEAAIATVVLQLNGMEGNLPGVIRKIRDYAEMLSLGVYD